MRNLIYILLGLFLMAGCANKVAEEEAEPISQEASITNQVVSTIALSGLDTDFFQPANVISDEVGNLYIADADYHVIYYLPQDGKATILAGTTTELDDLSLPLGALKDGKGTEARFNSPYGMALDKAGNLYVADSENGAIRKITAKGEVRTIVDGLLYPFDLVMSADEVLYVSDSLSHQIYQLTLAGDLTVLAGGNYEKEADYLVGAYKDGKGEAAQFNEPSGLALTPSGNLLIADTGNQRIRHMTPAGEVTTVAGSGDNFVLGATYIEADYLDGEKEAAKFNYPKSIVALDEETYIVADTFNHAIRLVKDGEVTTISGTGFAGHDDGNPAEATFYNPQSVFLADKQLIIADQFNHALRKIDVISK